MRRTDKKNAIKKKEEKKKKKKPTDGRIKIIMISCCINTNRWSLDRYSRLKDGGITHAEDDTI
jgi:hypothetical protein